MITGNNAIFTFFDSDNFNAKLSCQAVLKADSYQNAA